MSALLRWTLRGYLALIDWYGDRRICRFPNQTAGDKAHHIEGRAADCTGCTWARLRRAIANSWSAETSADSAWTPDNPSLGQCAVTALIVQDAYGGELIRTTVNGVSHYFNRLPNTVEIDLTRDQFAAWEPTDFAVRDRAYVLSFEPTAQRYAALLRGVLLHTSGGTA